MRKLNKGRKFSRPTSQQKALKRTLVSSLFMREKIKTTEAKAKEMRSVAERFITRAKSDTVANRRVVAQDLGPAAVEKLFKNIAPQYATRPGGYTRIIKLGARKSDGARMAIIELVK